LRHEQSKGSALRFVACINAQNTDGALCLQGRNTVLRSLRILWILQIITFEWKGRCRFAGTEPLFFSSGCVGTRQARQPCGSKCRVCREPHRFAACKAQLYGAFSKGSGSSLIESKGSRLLNRHLVATLACCSVDGFFLQSVKALRYCCKP
jgi:hypothetical protein